MAPDAARLPLRITVLVSGLSGLLALGTADLLSISATVAVAVCLVAGSAASVWLSAPAEARLRRWASLAVLVLVGGYAAHSAVAGLGDNPLVSIGPVLALLLCGLQVAHALVLNVRRDLLVGLTIGLFMTILAAGLAPGPAVAVPLLVSWPVGVTALVLAQRLEQLESGQLVATIRRSPRNLGSAGGSAGEPAGTSLVASTAGAVALSVVAGLVVFLLLPQPTGLSARSRLLGGDVASASSGQVRGPGFYSGGIMDLRTRGNLSDAPILDVPGDSPQLWRGTVLGTYDGQAWFGTTDALIEMTQGPTYAVPHPLDQVPSGTPRTDTVNLLSQFAGSIVAPGVVSSVTVTGRLLRDTDGGLTVMPAADGQLPTSYQVTSTPEVTAPQVLAAARGADPSDGRWLQLPATLPQRVRDLASQVTGGATTRYAAVSAVEAYLRGHEQYQLDSPLPPPGADAVDDFLFTSHLGFCEQFASAEVVLLRASGVPARMVTGLAYGTPLADGQRRMLVSDSHAWVEVYYPGVGWSPSDPTAGSTLAAPGGTSVLSRVLHAALDSARSRAVVAGMVVLLAVLVGFWVRWWVQRRRRGHGSAGGGPVPGPVLSAFRRLEAVLASTGRPRRPGESIGELRARLPGSGADALRTLERECYGARAPTEQESAHAVRVLDDLSQSLAEVTRR